MESSQKIENNSVGLSAVTNNAFVMDIDSNKEKSGVIDATVTTVQQDNFISESNSIPASKNLDSIDPDTVSQEYDVSYKFNRKYFWTSKLIMLDKSI